MLTGMAAPVEYGLTFQSGGILVLERPAVERRVGQGARYFGTLKTSAIARMVLIGDSYSSRDSCLTRASGGIKDPSTLTHDNRVVYLPLKTLAKHRDFTNYESQRSVSVIA
jgi:hypothetical protein